MIFLQDGLIEFFISQGASRSVAEDLATEFAEKAARAIERERRELKIADLFSRGKSYGVIARDAGCSKSTAHDVVKKSFGT